MLLSLHEVITTHFFLTMLPSDGFSAYYVRGAGLGDTFTSLCASVCHIQQQNMKNRSCFNFFQ